MTTQNDAKEVALLKAHIKLLEDKLAQTEVYNASSKAKISAEEWKVLFREQLNVNIVNTLHMQNRLIELMASMMSQSSDFSLREALLKLQPMIDNITE